MGTCYHSPAKQSGGPERKHTKESSSRGDALETLQVLSITESLKNSARSCQALQFCSLRPWTTTRWQRWVHREARQALYKHVDRTRLLTWTSRTKVTENRNANVFVGWFNREVGGDILVRLKPMILKGGGAEAHPPPSTLGVGSRLTQWAQSSVGFCWTLTFWGAWMPATHDTHSPKADTQPFHTVAAQIYLFQLVIRQRTMDFALGYTRLKSAFGKFHIVNRALFSAADGVHRVWPHRVWHHVLHSLRSSSAETDKQNKEEKLADGAGSLDVLLVVLSCVVPHKPFRLQTPCVLNDIHV